MRMGWSIMREKESRNPVSAEKRAGLWCQRSRFERRFGMEVSGTYATDRRYETVVVTL